MPEFDLAVRGGTIATTSGSYRADTGVKDGHVISIGERIESVTREVDDSGLLVMPGGVDAHAHLAQPTSDNTIMADVFESGMRAAAAGVRNSAAARLGWRPVCFEDVYGGSR